MEPCNAVYGQGKVQQGSDKILSLSKAAAEAKDKASPASREQIVSGDEADWFGVGKGRVVKRFAKHLEKHGNEIASTRVGYSVADCSGYCEDVS